MHVGDAVFGIAPGCMGHSVFVPVELMVCKPPTVSFEEAATVPTAYCTVYQAFNCVIMSPATKVMRIPKHSQLAQHCQYNHVILYLVS